MDPNEALRQLRAWIHVAHNTANDTEMADACVGLRDHAEALDGWLSRGGFLPDAWDEHRAFHARSGLPMGSPLCRRCAPSAAVVPGVGLVADPLGGPVPGVAGSHLPPGCEEKCDPHDSAHGHLREHDQ